MEAGVADGHAKTMAGLEEEAGAGHHLTSGCDSQAQESLLGSPTQGQSH